MSDLPISFEFFPPKTEQSAKSLINTAMTLSAFNPEYYSVTYGALGSTQERTLQTVEQLLSKELTVAPHLTCIGSSKTDIKNLLSHYQQVGINRLVCLRGDLPPGTTDTQGDFHYAQDLVAFVRETTGNHFHIEVAIYPEGHPEASSLQEDLAHFKNKVAAGANAAITQYFFDPNAYLQLKEDCDRLNINIPITPGIIPITNAKQLIRFSAQCGAQIPGWIQTRLEDFNDDIDSIKAFGHDVITRLCQQLINAGAPSLHFYTLNQAKACSDVLNSLQYQQADVYV